MVRTFLRCAAALCVLLLAGAAWAQDNDADVPGELHIKMNKDYAKLEVNGEEWAEHEFTDNGFTVVIKNLDRSRTHTIRLTPIYAEFQAGEITVDGKDFKKTRKKDKARVFYFVAHRTLTFPKADRSSEAPSPTPAPAPEALAPDAPAPGAE